MKEKQQIADIDRSVYDIKDQETDFYKIDAGLTPALVEQISKEKNDPVWMQQFRLHALQIFQRDVLLGGDEFQGDEFR